MRGVGWDAQKEKSRKRYCCCHRAIPLVLHRIQADAKVYSSTQPPRVRIRAFWDFSESGALEDGCWLEAGTLGRRSPKWKKASSLSVQCLVRWGIGRFWARCGWYMTCFVLCSAVGNHHIRRGLRGDHGGHAPTRTCEIRDVRRIRSCSCYSRLAC